MNGYEKRHWAVNCDGAIITMTTEGTHKEGSPQMTWTGPCPLGPHSHTWRRMHATSHAILTSDLEDDMPICTVCSGPVHWISCPTGGWFAHFIHPDDDHDAAVDIDPSDLELG